jgi:hypothetical protein
VPQTQEGYDTQWLPDYGVGEDAGKGRLIPTEKEGRPCCNAVIGPDDAIRGLARGAAKDGYPDCCGREVRKAGIFKLRLDDGSKLTCYRCGLHGGQTCGEGQSSSQCIHPGCSKGSHNGTRQIENPIGDEPKYWRYCNLTHREADAPRVALFTAIRDKLGNNSTVQAKLKNLNARQNKKDDNMTFDAALAQLKNILAAGTLQALQDALDAGPSSAGGA